MILNRYEPIKNHIVVILVYLHGLITRYQIQIIYKLCCHLSVSLCGIGLHPPDFALPVISLKLPDIALPVIVLHLHDFALPVLGKIYMILPSL